MNEPGYAAPSRAIRLVFEYEGDKLEVRDEIATETAIAPSDPIRGYEGESGFWIELRDDKGELVFRRILNNPIQFDVESHDPELGTRRHAVEKPRGVFTVLVPDVADARDLIVVASPLDAERRAAPAEPLVRFRLGEQRKRGR
jgi:hypothetical protein